MLAARKLLIVVFQKNNFNNNVLKVMFTSWRFIQNCPPIIFPTGIKYGLNILRIVLN